MILQGCLIEHRNDPLSLLPDVAFPPPPLDEFGEDELE